MNVGIEIQRFDCLADSCGGAWVYFFGIVNRPRDSGRGDLGALGYLFDAHEERYLAAA